MSGLPFHLSLTRWTARQAALFTSWLQILRLLTTISIAGGLTIDVASRIYSPPPCKSTYADRFGKFLAVFRASRNFLLLSAQLLDLPAAVAREHSDYDVVVEILRCAWRSRLTAADALMARAYHAPLHCHHAIME
jgi:hypothetical protein